jgi:hypothetical protein
VKQAPASPFFLLAARAWPTISYMDRLWKLRGGSAEFPHGNPALEWFAVWAAQEPGDDEPVPVRSVPAPAPPADRPDPFAYFVEAVAQVAAMFGGDDASTWASRLLTGAALVSAEELAPPPLILDALRAGAILDPTGATSSPSDPFARATTQWRRALRGEPSDLGSCAAEPLDDWAASLVAQLAPGRDLGSIRRELRRRGIAAFGLVAPRGGSRAPAYPVQEARTGI